MKDIYRIDESGEGLTGEQIRGALEESLRGRTPRRVLILPPDYTRFHSGAGAITQYYYRALTERGAEVDVMPALGTHAPVTERQWERMFGDIPYEKMSPPA